MRISELSRRSGVTIPTIKYYLRENLLPPGRATAATQAEYDETHVRRLRLIRALIGVRGLPVHATRDVLGALADGEHTTHQMLGLALGVSPVHRGAEGGGQGCGPHLAQVNALVSAMGWRVGEDSPAKGVIAEALRALHGLGLTFDWGSLVPYAELAQETAVRDLDQLRDANDSLERAERAVLLTVLLEPALLALRRLAQENESAIRNRA